MGLKSGRALILILLIFSLKSDQNGIEIPYIAEDGEIIEVLKSDQNGIEIRNLLGCLRVAKG